jgi:putative component of membrane protein insertase Oxa1/YidC/SpoIIIJ protein YidD
LLLFIQTPAASAGADPLNPAPDNPAAAVRAQQSPSPGATIFTAMITFFQKVVSPVDGDRCPSFPTCAAYSKQAYQKHGAVLGTLMTVDRLIHEASEARFSPTITVHGVPRIYDPVSANEFWLRHHRQPDK